MLKIDELWNHGTLDDWERALDHYWDLVRNDLKPRERWMEENVTPSFVADLSVRGWYDFLFDEYFAWKFTDNRWLKLNRTHLRKHETDLAGLDDIRQRMLGFDPADIQDGLKIVTGIHGLWVAGASGLLALLYPNHFGTVDRFVVDSLQHVSCLNPGPVMKIKPGDILVSQAVGLIAIMRDKACELNKQFRIDYFTPRKIDKVLWSYRSESPHKGRRKPCRK